MIERLKQIPVGVNWIILGLSVSLIILTLQFPAYRMDSWVYEYFGTEINIWWLTLHRNLFGVAVMGLVILLNYKIVPGNAGRYLSGLLSHRFWRIPARLSFPMYLFQFPIIFVSSLILFWTTDYTSISHFRLTDIFYIFVIATSITVTISILLHRFIEMPMIRIGKSLTDGT
jgi:peptidoglycan/LPS O-acetylase OafA/YrhL